MDNPSEYVERVKQMYGEECCKKHITECLKEYKLEVSEEDFNRLVKLQERDKDAKWIISVMAQYNKSLVDALISYISY